MTAGPTHTRPRRPKVSKKRAPTRAVEKELWERGHDTVVGIDEVGRGAWAGPLMVGAAVLPRATRVNGVRDSKLLTEPEREQLFARIAGWCEAWAVGSATQDECDRLGMSAAQKLAARRAVEALGVQPDIAVTDGRWDFVSPSVPRVELMVKADMRCLSVAAASILAKVTRDRHMRELADEYPHWWFDTNKGYPCPRHKSALLGYGPSAIHRRTWVFMDHYVPWTAVKRVPPAGQESLF
jgi:ribonuclease HII